MKKIFTFFALLVCVTLFAQAGTLDPSFGINGIYKSGDTVNGDHNTITAVKVLPDGKIIMAGSGNFYVSDGTHDMTVFRLTANGQLDSSFGTKGKVIIDFATDSDFVGTDENGTSLAIQPDGKIVVACTIGLYPQKPNVYGFYNKEDIGVARLNSDGSLDKSFDSTGKKRIDLETYANSLFDYEVCNSIALRANGKIVLGGDIYNNSKPNSSSEDYDALLVQLNGNGTFDNTFGNKGVQIFTKFGTDEFISSIALQSDDNLVMFGNTGTARESTTNNLLLMRTTPAGNLDKNFNKTGYIVTDILNKSKDVGISVAIQPNGKIVASGYFTQNVNVESSYLLRYNTNGKLDATFGNKGKSFIDSSVANSPTSLSLTNDGKIILTTSFFSVYRINPNGSRDSSFGTNGITSFNSTKWSCFASAVQPDNKIIAAGFSYFSFGRNGAGYTETAVRYLGSSPNINLNKTTDHLIVNKVSILPSNDLKAVVYPNPSHNHFMMQVNSRNLNDKISVRISDVSGKLVEVLTNIASGESKQFGSQYLPGAYVIDIIQGNLHKTLKLVKL